MDFLEGPWLACMQTRQVWGDGRLGEGRIIAWDLCLRGGEDLELLRNTSSCNGREVLSRHGIVAEKGSSIAVSYGSTRDKPKFMIVWKKKKPLKGSIFHQDMVVLDFHKFVNNDGRIWVGNQSQDWGSSKLATWGAVFNFSPSGYRYHRCLIKYIKYARVSISPLTSCIHLPMQALWNRNNLAPLLGCQSPFPWVYFCRKSW